jgi:uncharacterized protein
MFANSVAIEVRESTIHGLGCFSTSVITRDSVIAEYDGELIDYAEAVRRNDKTYSAHSDYVLQVDDNVFIDAVHSSNASRYFNHSCEPNCILWTRGTRAFIVALRQIPAGQELTYDYEFDPEYREPCYCGAPTCRGYM